MKAWPKVAPGELLRRFDEPAAIDPAAEYHEVTPRSHPQAVEQRGHRPILSRIDVRSGATGLMTASQKSTQRRQEQSPGTEP